MKERIPPLTKLSTFVGRIPELATFRQRLSIATIPAPIYSVTGPGGIGKSTVFARFEQISDEEDFTILRVDLEECRSAADVLTKLTSGPEGSVRFNRLRDSQSRLVQIWRMVGKKTRVWPGLLKDFAGAGIGGTVGGMLAGPAGIFVGATAGALAGTLTEQVAQSTMQTFSNVGISTDDALFAMDPEGALTSAFIEDVNMASNECRILLMLDGYDVPKRWNPWLFQMLLAPAGLKQQIPIAVSGRDHLGIEWRKLDREIVEFPLLPLLPGEAAQLARELGVTSEATINGIVTESHCIPWKVELLAEASLAGNLPQSTQTILGDSSNRLFVERVLNHLDDRQRTIVEAASIVRQFDQDRLKALLPARIESAEFYNFLQLGFIDQQTDGLWAVSNPVREELVRGMQQRAPDQYLGYNLKAATFFRTKMIRSTAEVRTNAAANSVYHALHCDPPTQITLTIEIFSLAAWPPDLATCDAIVGEVRARAADDESASCLQQYLEARIQGLRSEWMVARATLSKLSHTEGHCPPHLLGLALEQLGWIELYQGDLEAALKAFQKAHETFVSLGASAEIQLLLNKLGRANRRLGRWDLARAYHELITAEQLDSGAPTPAHIEAYRCLSRLWRDRGEWQKAIEACEKSIQLARAAKQTFDEALGSARAAELYCAEGRWNDAEISCNAAFPILLASKNDLAIGSAYHNSGRIAMWRDAKNQCLSSYVTALFHYRRFSANVGVVLLYLDLARFWIFQWQFDRALRYIHDATELAQTVGDRLPLATCCYLRGEVARLTGRFPEAKEEFVSALHDFERAENLYRVKETLLGLVMCLWKLQDPTYATARAKLRRLFRKETSVYLKLRFRLLELLLGKAKRRKATRDDISKIAEDAEHYSPTLGRQFINELGAIATPNFDRNAKHKQSANDETSIRNSSDYVISAAGELKINPGGESEKATIAGTFVILHHGLSSMRAEERVQGRVDSDLDPASNDTASKQSHAAVEQFAIRGVDWSTISLHTAPARRAYETAFLVAKELTKRMASDIEIRVWMDLDNICLGEWEGRLKSEMLSVIGYSRLSSGVDFGVKPPGLSPDNCYGERLLDVIARSISVLRLIARDRRNAIIVGHKMSLVIPATLLWAPSLVTDSHNRINWRNLKIPPGGFIVFDSGEAKIGSYESSC